MRALRRLGAGSTWARWRPKHPYKGRHIIQTLGRGVQNRATTAFKRQHFAYELPDELIAHFPAPDRVSSRLLTLDGTTGEVGHEESYNALVDLVQPGDLMVFNNTRVIPARVYGRKKPRTDVRGASPVGGKIEVLVERLVGERTALCHIKASRAPRAGEEVRLGEDHQPHFRARVVGRQGQLFELELVGRQEEGNEDTAAATMADSTPLSLLDVLETIGHMPLPPYIKRPDQEADKESYQTVYSDRARPGAVAAPTAGLHFTDELLEELKAKGVKQAFVTLHVGAGTFQPVKVEDIASHTMHSEWLEVSPEVCEQVLATKRAGGRVIAVGTTSVRCLETACTPELWQEQPADGAESSGTSEGSWDAITPYQGDTDIFIYPGYKWRCVDCLVTNFHLPESTLLMLVSSFAGYEPTMEAYRQAVQNRYRFFSYGDGMFITRRPEDAPPEVPPVLEED